MYHTYKKNAYLTAEMCFSSGTNMFPTYKDNFKSYFPCQKTKTSTSSKSIFLVIYRESRHLKTENKNVIKIKSQ